MHGRRFLLNRWELTAAVCAVVTIPVRADAQKPTQTPPFSPSAATAQAQAKENRNAPELAEFKKNVRLRNTMPEEFEYRFVGDSLILLDPHARIVADLVPKALPE